MDRNGAGVSPSRLHKFRRSRRHPFGHGSRAFERTDSKKLEPRERRRSLVVRMRALAMLRR